MGAAALSVQHNHVFYTHVERGIDHVFGTEDIGLDALHRVVLRSRHLFESGCMDDDVDAFACSAETVAIAHIADKEANEWVIFFGIELAHFELLELVARVNYQTLDTREALGNGFNKFLSKRSGSSCDEDALAVQVQYVTHSSSLYGSLK